MNSLRNAGVLSLRLAVALSLILFSASCAGLGSGGSTPQDPLEAAGPAPGKPSSEETPVVTGSSDLLRPGDVVIVSFSGVTDPPRETTDRITEDGFITLPLVGRVKAASKTRAELQTQIQDAYVPRLYQRLTVTVNPATRFIYVRGEVKKEGPYEYVGQMTVLKAVTAAGGFTDFAKKTRVELTRANGKKIRINCIKAQDDSSLDVILFPDDQIFVPRRLF